jgi:hypothetical protein
MKTIEIKIPFVVYENEDSFFKYNESRIETIFVTCIQNPHEETIYKIRFKDIGLNTEFGEIEIVNKNGFFEWLDNTDQIKLIINKIIEQLILQNI